MSVTKRWDDKQAEVEAAIAVAYRAVTGLTVGDIDGEFRDGAMRKLSEAIGWVRDGLNSRRIEALQEAAKALESPEQKALLRQIVELRQRW